MCGLGFGLATLTALDSAISATSVVNPVPNERPAYLVLAVLLAVCSVKAMTGWAMGNGKVESGKRRA